jgi:hypothetical protein
MKKHILFLAIIMGFIACKTKPYLNKKISVARIAAICNEGDGDIKMNSNTNGEHYEIYKCLDDDFTEKMMGVTRIGDTVNIQFENQFKNKAFFKVTVDIDAYPRYNFINIDGVVTPIMPASN